jgi:CheY-like chemotaxis protein
MVDIIHNSGETLLSLINDILDFSKIESQKLELEASPFNLRQSIEEALDLLAVKAPEKGLELAYLIDRQLPAVLIGDVTRLGQVLVNLLSNAVKFTAKGEVVVEVQGQLIGHNRYQLNFTVRDTGIGIPRECIGGLFDSFSQVDGSTTRQYGGTGLGLAISKRLVEMMGGMIGVQSTLGRGSTFCFSIVAEAMADQKEKDLHSCSAMLSDKRLLIVDDNQTNRRILTSQSKSWGMSPVAVASGPEALRLLMNESFDIAILDMQMPFMDGLSLAKKIRQLSQDGSELPLIILTSLGLGKPMDDELTNLTYLTKPTKSAQLREILTTLLAAPTKLGQVVSQPTTLSNHFDQQMASRHPLRILLAEDNIVNQKVALHLLQRLGYDAEVANNGLEVLLALQEALYDVVLMDVDMPQMNGIEATQQIHSQTTDRKRPHIIAMTAHALAGDRARLIAVGMDDYISKPIGVKEFVSALQRTPSALTVTQTSTSNSIMEFVSQAVEQMIGQRDSQTLKELITLFLDDARQQVSLLRQCFNNRQELLYISHTLKGSSASLGLTSLSTLCKKLEEIVIEGSSKASLVPQKVAEIEVEYKRIQNALIYDLGEPLPPRA